MEKSIEVVSYLSSISNKPSTFVEFNGHKMNVREFCVYKTMYLANIFHKLIFDNFLVPTSDFEAWTNGPVNVVARNQSIIKPIKLKPQSVDFLDKINDYFSEFEPEELYTITHWDPAFKNAAKNEVMKTENYFDIYRVEFKDSLDDFIRVEKINAK